MFLFKRFIMTFISWSQVNSAAKDFGTQFGQQAKTFACSLWNNYPQFLSGQTPGSSALQGFWNSICDPPTLPPTPPFSGGQCDDLPYYCTCSSKGVVRVQSGVFYGKVGAIDCYVQNGNQYIIRVYRGNQQISSGAAYSEYPDGSPITPDVLVQGNLPDNCGSLPTEYPPVPPPNPGDEQTTINITNEGDNNNQFSFPLIWNDVDFNFPLKFDFPAGNLKLNFDGININFDKNNDWHITNNNNDNDNIVNNINNNFIGGGSPPDLDSQDKEEEPETEESEEKKVGITAVKIEVVVPPKKGKTIILPNSSDNTFFAGYFSWILDDARSEEYPIRKYSNIFVRPSWAQGYRAYTVNGAKIKVTIYSQD